MLQPLSPTSTHYQRRLLLLPSVGNGMCMQTLEMAAALRQDGFEVDIADADGELSDLLSKASQSQQPYPAVILGLGMSPTETDMQKPRLIWRYIPNTFIVACAAEFSRSWKLEAGKLSRGGQLFMLDNPVDILMLRRLAASLVSVAGKQEEMRGKLEQMVHTVAACAHEIRTPMTAILGFAEKLLEPGLSEKDRITAAATIQRNGHHLLSIINEILDFSKIEAGKMEIERIECSPGQLLDDVHSLMKEKARRKHLCFTVSRLGEVPKIIVSDPTRIRQILINLIDNAIKFTAHGSVRICYGREERGGAGEAIFFEVKDTGIGMRDDQIERLFMPFSQADSSITRRYGGTGLGLSICKHLADRLGGEISVQSRFGEGSTFRIVIPFSAPPEQDRSHDTAHSPGNKGLLGRRILVAEDAPDNQRLICMILEKAGAKVEMAGNGLAAVEMAVEAMRGEKSFDIVLMDIQMPILDGYQATVRLREEGYTGPIIALTANAMGSEIDRILAAGCNAYLAKPFTRQGLLSAIAEIAQVNHRRTSNA